MDLTTMLRKLRRSIASFAVVAIIASLSVASAVSAFSDVKESDWYYSNVQDLVDAGVLDGTKDKFNGGANLNRAEAAKIAVLAAGVAEEDLVSSETPSFSDVPKSLWAYKYVETAKSLGFVSGDAGKKTFRPGDNVNRAEYAKMMSLALELEENTAGGPHFKDVKSSDWFYNVVETAYNWSVVNGYEGGMFKPAAAINRAEMSKMTVAAMDPVAREEVVPTPAPGVDCKVTPDAVGCKVTPPPVSNVGFSVATASDNPSGAGVTLPSGSAYNTLLKVQVNAGEAERSITSISLERFGVSIDSNVTGVLVVDAAGKRHGNVVTFSENKATIDFSVDPIKIAKGASAPITIQAHLATGALSGNVGVKLTGMSGTPTGLPVLGGSYSLSDGVSVLGSLTVGLQSLTSTTVSVDVATKDYILSKFRFTGGANEDLEISKVTMFQNGTAADEDLTNWRLVDPTVAENAGVLATVAKASSKQITFDLSAKPYKLAKGITRDLSVYVDVAGGSSRTAQVVIQNDYDVVAKGLSTNLGILPTASSSGSDTSLPIGDITTGNAGFNHLTVAEGSLTLVKSSTSPSGNVGIGASNITLAIWELEAKGEDIEIQRGDIALGGTAAADYSGTIRLMTDGGQTLLSFTSASDTGTSALDGDLAGSDVTTFASYYTVNAGKTLKLKLVADASTTMGTTDAPVARISNVYFKRKLSNTFGTASAATYVSGNTLTPIAPSIAVTPNGDFAAKQIIEGQNDVRLGSFLLQTGTTEGVNISTIAVGLTVGGQAALSAVSNLKLKKVDGTQLGTTIASATATNTFTVAGKLNVAANTTVQVDLYGNLTTAAADGGANDTYVASIAVIGVSGSGVTSGTSVEGPVTAAGAATSATLTVVETGTIAFSIDTSGAASSQFYTPSLAGVEMARVKLAATVEDMKIERLELRTIRGSANIASVKLMGTGLTSDPSVPLTAGTAVFTFPTGSEITIPANSSKVLTVVVNTTGLQTLTAAQLGIVGFATANVKGGGTGQVVQESLTGNSYVAGTNAFAGGTPTEGAGDVIYFTVAGDGAGTGDDTPGYKMVTAIVDTNLTIAASLTLEGVAAASWAAGDRITRLSTTSTEIDGDSDSNNALAVGDLVYFYGDVAGTDNSASTGWHIVTTATAANTGTIVLDGSNVIVDVGDGIARFANASAVTALAGNVMRFEEVEPVITAVTPSTTSMSPNTDQVVATFNIKAEGGRDMTFNRLNLEKSGSNNSHKNVTRFSLWNGNSKLSEVATTTLTGTTDDGAGATLTYTAATYEICSGAPNGNDDIGNISSAEWATLQAGDRIRFEDDAGTFNTVRISTKNDGGSDNLVTATCDGTDSIILDAAPTGLTGDKTVTIYNFMVHFDTLASNTGDIALTQQTITAGQTMTLAVKADTASVRTDVTQGAVSFGVSIPGSAGPLQVLSSQVEGFNWDYTPINTAGTAVDKTEADSYPVNAATLSY